MARHMVILFVHDEWGDIQSEEDLDDFVSDLKQSTHYSLDALYDYNTSQFFGVEDEED